MTSSNDLCDTWSAPAVVARNGDVAQGPYPFKLDIAASAGGLVAVGFYQFPTGQAYAAVSNDFGASWSIPSRLDLGNNFFLPEVGVDPGGTTVYTVHDEDFVGPNQCCALPIVRKSTDAGLSFSAPAELSNLVGGGNALVFSLWSTLSVAHDGGVLVASLLWDFNTFVTRVVVSRSPDGINFTTAFDETLPGGLVSTTFPQLHTRPGSSTVLVSYVDRLGQLVLSRSADHGASFGPPQQLSATAHDGTTFLRRSVDVVPMSAGQWALAWPDTRDAGPERDRDIYVRLSLDDGLSWGPEQRINDSLPVPASPDFPGLAVPGTGELFVVFEDDRETGGTHADLFASRSIAPFTAFEDDYRIDVDTRSTTTEVNFEIGLTSDRSSHVYAIFHTPAEGPRGDLYVAASDDGGYHFAPPVRITASNPGTANPREPIVRATPDGFVAALYASQNTLGGPVELRLNRSSDFGATWMADAILVGEVSSADSTQYKLSAVVGGRIQIAWTDTSGNLYLSILDPGSTLLSTVFLASSFTRDPVLCARDSTVGLAWRQGGNVYGTVSFNGGINFSTATRLDDAGSSARSRSLAIDCGGAGNVAVGWMGSAGGLRLIQSNRFDGSAWLPGPVILEFAGVTSSSFVRVAYQGSGPDDLVVVYPALESGSGGVSLKAARSADGGVAFFAPQVVADSSSTNVSGSPRLVTDRQGNAWISWIDLGVEGNSSIVVSRSVGLGIFQAPRRLDRMLPPRAYFNTYDSNLDTSAAALPGAGLFAWVGQRTSFDDDALFNADDLDDGDRDMAPNATDNCPDLPNPDQIDTDQDGDGNACDPDDDNDGVPDEQDNCPLDFNPDQLDSDGNGVGNACEPCPDQDGDGFGFPGFPGCAGGALEDCDDLDATVFPGAPEVYDALDQDCDGVADNGLDDDGDGIPNFYDLCPGTPPGSGVDPSGCDVCMPGDDDQGDDDDNGRRPLFRLTTAGDPSGLERR